LRQHQPRARARGGVPAPGPVALEGSAAHGGGLGQQRGALPVPSCERLATHDHGSRQRAQAQRLEPRSRPGFTGPCRPAILVAFSFRERHAQSVGLPPPGASVNPVPPLTEDAVGVGSVSGGLGALLRWIRPTFDNPGAPRPALDIGYFANVIPVAPNLGIAISTDGVGTKLLVAQAAARYD